MKRVDFSPYVAELRVSAPHPPKIPHVTLAVPLHVLLSALSQFAKTYHYAFEPSSRQKTSYMHVLELRCCRHRCRYKLSVRCEPLDGLGAQAWLDYDTNTLEEHNHELDGSDLSERDRKRMRVLERRRRRELKEFIQQDVQEVQQDGMGKDDNDNDNENEPKNEEEPLFLYSDGEGPESSPVEELSDEIQEIAVIHKPRRAKTKVKDKAKQVPIKVISLDSSSEDEVFFEAQDTMEGIQAEEPLSPKPNSVKETLQRVKDRKLEKEREKRELKQQRLDRIKQRVRDKEQEQERAEREKAEQEKQTRLERIVPKRLKRLHNAAKSRLKKIGLSGGALAAAAAKEMEGQKVLVEEKQVRKEEEDKEEEESKEETRKKLKAPKSKRKVHRVIVEEEQVEVEEVEVEEVEVVEVEEVEVEEVEVEEVEVEEVEVEEVEVEEVEVEEVEVEEVEEQVEVEEVEKDKKYISPYVFLGFDVPQDDDDEYQESDSVDQEDSVVQEEEESDVQDSFISHDSGRDDRQYEDAEEQSEEENAQSDAANYDSETKATFSVESPSRSKKWMQCLYCPRRFSATKTPGSTPQSEWLVHVQLIHPELVVYADDEEAHSEDSDVNTKKSRPVVESDDEDVPDEVEDMDVPDEFSDMDVDPVEVETTEPVRSPKGKSPDPAETAKSPEHVFSPDYAELAERAYADTTYSETYSKTTPSPAKAVSKSSPVKAVSKSTPVKAVSKPASPAKTAPKTPVKSASKPVEFSEPASPVAKPVSKPSTPAKTVSKPVSKPSTLVSPVKPATQLDTTKSASPVRTVSKPAEKPSSPVKTVSKPAEKPTSKPSSPFQTVFKPATTEDATTSASKPSPVKDATKSASRASPEVIILDEMPAKRPLDSPSSEQPQKKRQFQEQPRIDVDAGRSTVNHPVNPPMQNPGSMQRHPETLRLETSGTQTANGNTSIYKTGELFAQLALLGHDDAGDESESSVSEPDSSVELPNNAATLQLAQYFRNNRLWHSSIFTRENDASLSATLICYAHVIGAKFAKVYPEVMMVDLQKSMIEVGGVDATGEHFPIAFAHSLGHPMSIHATLRWLKTVVYAANGIPDPSVIVTTHELPDSVSKVVFPHASIVRNRAQVDKFVLAGRDPRLSDVWMHVAGLTSRRHVRNVPSVFARLNMVPFADFDKWFRKNGRTICPAYVDHCLHFNELRVIPGTLQATETRASDPLGSFHALSANSLARYKAIVRHQEWERNNPVPGADFVGLISHKAAELLMYHETASVAKCGGEGVPHRWDLCVSNVVGVPCKNSLKYARREGFPKDAVHPHWLLMNPQLLYSEDFAPTVNSIVYPESAVQSEMLEEGRLKSMFGGQS
ncbi:Merozoite surface protein CMZ-8 [Yarrowia sp. B02]|nr:Merozoite surface protein CMZ-8 [Yarrowia sp. B02]